MDAEVGLIALATALDGEVEIDRHEYHRGSVKRMVSCKGMVAWKQPPEHPSFGDM
jgi:hypothetical protein